MPRWRRQSIVAALKDGADALSGGLLEEQHRDIGRQLGGAAQRCQGGDVPPSGGIDHHGRCEFDDHHDETRDVGVQRDVRGIGAVLDAADQAEVASGIEHDIGRAHVAVDGAGRVKGGQHGRRVARDPARLRFRQRPAFAQKVSDRGPSPRLGDHESWAVDARRDVGVVNQS